MSEAAAKTPEPQTKETAKVAAGWPLPAFKFASWGEAVDFVSKSVLFIFGSAYIIGLLILNFHIRWYGLYYLGFLRIEYVMAGLLWGFLVGTLYLCGYYLADKTTRVYRQEQRGRLKKFLRGIRILVETLSALGICFYILSVVSDYELTYRNANSYVVLLTLLLNVVTLTLMVYAVKVAIPRLGSKGDLASKDDKGTRLHRRGGYFLVPYSLALFLIGLSFYAQYVFPNLSPVFGGGKKQKAEFIIKAEQLDTLNSLGLQVNNRTVGPLEVVFEGADFFTVTPPEGFAKDKVKAIRIRKDMIDAALYFSEQK